MLNATVAHRFADLIDPHIGLDQQFLGAADAQVVEMVDEGAAAFLGEAGAEILFAEAHIVRHRAQGEPSLEQTELAIRVKLRAQQFALASEIKFFRNCSRDNSN